MEPHLKAQYLVNKFRKWNLAFGKIVAIEVAEEIIKSTQYKGYWKQVLKEIEKL